MGFGCIEGNVLLLEVVGPSKGFLRDETDWMKVRVSSKGGAKIDDEMTSVAGGAVGEAEKRELDNFEVTACF